MRSFRKKLQSVSFFVPYLFVVLVVVLVRFVFTSDLHVFLVFMGLTVTYIVLKFDGRILVGMALVCLVLAAINLAVGNDAYANQVAIYAYWFLVSGVICLLAEYLREKPSEKSED